MSLSLNTPYFGGFLMLSEISFSMILATIVKLLYPEIPVGIVLLARYIFCLPLLFALGLYQHGKRVLKISNKRLVFYRITAGFLGLVFWFLSVSKLNLSTATVLFQTVVIFVTILSFLFLKERTNFRQWLAIGIGFLGTIFLIQPDLSSINSWGIFFGFAAPLSSAFMFVFLRQIGKTEYPVSAALWYNMTGAGLMLLWCLLFVSDFEISGEYWVILISFGLVASFQQASMAFSHKYADAGTLAPLNYLSIPISMVAGYFLFNETFDRYFIIGTFAIIFSTYFVSLRKMRQAKKNTN